MENNDYFHDFQFFPSTRISHPVIELHAEDTHECMATNEYVWVRGGAHLL